MKKLNKDNSILENSVESYMFASVDSNNCICNCGSTYWEARYYADLSTN